jgi:23S rRNA pseudouridine2457 synthase
VPINVDGKIYQTKPAQLENLPDTIAVPERNPPIRFRKSIPTSWVAIQITEGKHRQVRKMFAQVGFPVLRLIRAKLGKYSIDKMQPGDCLSLTASEVQEGFFR